MEDLFKCISVSGRGFNMQGAATKTLLVPCAEVCNHAGLKLQELLPQSSFGIA